MVNMRESITEGTICLKDDYGIEYKISKITYTEREDESFFYVFRPYYEVTDMLGPELFQGIPGLNLETRREEYVRENIIPTFISERSPGKNRENLTEMLEQVGMTYLNQLEWLIRTDMQYSGDRMYVKRYSQEDEKCTVCTELSPKRLLNACRDTLDIICYGNDIHSESYDIDDNNRRDFYGLLYRLYSNEMDIRRQTLTDGIKSGAANGHYKGRRKKDINTPKLNEVSKALAAHRISEAEAMERLGVSRATLYRRLKEARQSEIV